MDLVIIDSVDGSNEDEEEIEEDGNQISEVDHAKAVAEAFGKSSKSKTASSSSMEVDEVADGLKELDMDNYDEEDDGTFSSFDFCSLFDVCSTNIKVKILIRTEILCVSFVKLPFFCCVGLRS